MLVNPTGLFFANMDVYAGHTPSKESYAQFSREAASVTHTVLNDPDSARQQRAAGVPYVVYRQSEWEPDVPRNETRAQIRELARGIYQAARNLRSRVMDPTIHIMVNCEQDPHPARYTMYVELMNAAMQDQLGPVGMVFSNVATGVLKSGQRGEPNDWAHPARLEYLLTLDKYRNVRLSSGSYAFIHGTHGYTALYPWIAVNGGQHRFTPEGFALHNWAEGYKFMDGRAHINWDLPQDHLGREFQGMQLALGWVWDDTSRTWKSNASSIGLPPWSIVTEGIIDAMNDVRYLHAKDMTFTPEFPEPMGYRTLARTWSRPDWFPENTPSHTLALFNQWVWEVVYAPTGYFIGTQYYASGATGPETRTHNVSHTGQMDADFFNTTKVYRVNVADHFFKDVPNDPPPSPPVVVIPPVVLPNKNIDAALSYLENAEDNLKRAKLILKELL